jgi:hypothetical protein
VPADNPSTLGMACLEDAYGQRGSNAAPEEVLIFRPDRNAEQNGNRRAFNSWLPSLTPYKRWRWPPYPCVPQIE